MTLEARDPATSAVQVAGQIQLLDVAASARGGGWAVGRDLDRGTVHGYRLADAGVEEVATLPTWDGGVSVVTVGDAVIAAGVRCTDATCAETVGELGRVVEGRWQPLAIAGRHGGPPSSADAVAIVGATDGTIWALGIDSRLRGFSLTDGAVVADPGSVGGEPCVVGDELLVLRSSGRSEPPGNEAEVIDLSARSSYEVLRWDGAELVPVPGGRLGAEASPGGLERCGPAGFEVEGTDRSAVWTEPSGWRQVAVRPQLSSPRSFVAVTDDGRHFVVDDAGGLVELRHGAQQPTGLVFELVPGSGEPPLALAVDAVGEALAACLIDSAKRPIQTECATR